METETETVTGATKVTFQLNGNQQFGKRDGDGNGSNQSYVQVRISTMETRDGDGDGSYQSYVPVK